VGGVLNFKRTYGVALDWLFAGAGEPPPFRLRVVSFVRAAGARLAIQSLFATDRFHFLHRQ
jgi:hypothetical protein